MSVKNREWGGGPNETGSYKIPVGAGTVTQIDPCGYMECERGFLFLEEHV